MGNRLTKIATRTGDDGTTGLGDGSRVAKSDGRITALGDVDELNSQLGVLRSTAGVTPEVDAMLSTIQHDLFDLGGELSIPGFMLVKDAQVGQLDAWLEASNAGLSRLAEFILPGGTPAAAQAHVCRSVCRRAERSVVSLAAQGGVNQAPRLYLNRLSDLLFVLARVLNQAGGRGDVMWRRDREST
jgi:cob(I)alamin adenosyltransferase